MYSRLALSSQSTNGQFSHTLDDQQFQYRSVKNLKQDHKLTMNVQDNQPTIINNSICLQEQIFSQIENKLISYQQNINLGDNPFFQTIASICDQNNEDQCTKYYSSYGQKKQQQLTINENKLINKENSNLLDSLNDKQQSGLDYNNQYDENTNIEMSKYFGNKCFNVKSFKKITNYCHFNFDSDQQMRTNEQQVPQESGLSVQNINNNIFNNASDKDSNHYNNSNQNNSKPQRNSLKEKQLQEKPLNIQSQNILKTEQNNPCDFLQQLENHPLLLAEGACSQQEIALKMLNINTKKSQLLTQTHTTNIQKNKCGNDKCQKAPMKQKRNANNPDKMIKNKPRISSQFFQTSIENLDIQQNSCRLTDNKSTKNQTRNDLTLASNATCQKIRQNQQTIANNLVRKHQQLLINTKTPNNNISSTTLHQLLKESDYFNYKSTKNSSLLKENNINNNSFKKKESKLIILNIQKNNCQ